MWLARYTAVYRRVCYCTVRSDRLTGTSATARSGIYSNQHTKIQDQHQ